MFGIVLWGMQLVLLGFHRSFLGGAHLGRLARYAGVGAALSRPRWDLGLLLIISLNSLEGTLGHPCGLCTKHYNACLY